MLTIAVSKIQCTFVQNTLPLKNFFFFSFKEINAFTQQGCIKLIQSDSKYIYVV